MDVLLVFGIGVAFGSVLTWAIIEIQVQFRKSRDLEASVVRTRKEIGEKAAKARLDKRKARSTAMRSIFFTVLLGVAAFFLIWLAAASLLYDWF